METRDQVCPSASALSDFGLGKLDGASAEAISRHLEACSLCRQQVADLPGDDLIEGLRRAHLAQDGDGARFSEQSTVHSGRDWDNKQAGAPDHPSFDDTAPWSAHDAAPLETFPQVPGYEILGELGRGGMGVVYRARQSRANRIVALKMILAGNLATSEEISRFHREAEAAAKLDHAGIVPIFEVGEGSGQHFFSMSLVDGPNLADRLARGPLSPRDAAAMVEKIATAVEYAHGRGIIHRDLKPRNILLTSDGQPKITDFGLAKNLEADQAQTASGAILGTPGYMSPEQARGQAGLIDIRSDVYSLGAILYCVLTGRPPFQAQSLVETLRQVVECEPASPRLLNPAVSRDLETICLRCLAKEPGERLQTAQELADELRRYLRGEPIRSRRTGPIARALRWTRRKPLAAALCVAVVVLLASLWAAGRLAGRATRSQQLAKMVTRFEAGLDTLTLTEEALPELDELIAKIRPLSPEQADQAKARLSEALARLIEQSIRMPKLAAADVERIEAALLLLDPRDSSRADQLRKSLEERRVRWQELFSLEPPFTSFKDVFGTSRLLRVDPEAVRLSDANTETAPPAQRVLTRVACRGDVQLDAMFAESWQSGGEIGLILNASPTSGYSFVLRLPPASASDGEEQRQPVIASFSEARAAGGLVLEEIRRNNVALVRRTRPASDLPAGPLRLSVRRQRDELALQIDTLPALRFFDPFPIESEGGVFGMRWSPSAPLASLRALARSQPRRHSVLEEADAAYDEERFSDALDLYREQLVTAADVEYRQEAQYKSALCLASLNRRQEAEGVFEDLLADDGERWPPLAGCRLWVIRLRQQRAADAEAIFENLSGRYDFEQLAAIIPADMREEVLQNYTNEFNKLDQLLRFTPQRVAHAERALAVDRLLNPDPAGNAGLRLLLVRAYQSLGDWDRALELALPLATANPWDASIQTLYLRLLRLRGESHEALDTVNRLLREAPQELRGFRQAMLLERSRTNAACGYFENAEMDVDDLLNQPLTEDFLKEITLGQRRLLQGALRHRRGDVAGAMDAWREGFAELRRLRDDAPLSTPSRVCLQILGSLTDELTEEDAALFVDHFAAEAGSSPIFQLARQVVSPQAYTAVLRRMWRSRRGRLLADDFAFNRIAVTQRVRLPIQLIGAEFIGNELFGGDWSPDQEDLAHHTAENLYSAIVERGVIGRAQLAQGALAWKGVSGGLGWAGVAKTLGNDLRGQFAYFLAHRYLKLDRRQDAESLLREAIAAAPDSAAARLAQIDLDLLTQGRGLLILESEAPGPINLSLASPHDEAELLRVDQRGEVPLSPGVYRMFLADQPGGLTLSPAEIEIAPLSRRTVRVLWRWRPQSSGQALPGLAASPSPTAMGGRWQIETRVPRWGSALARSPDGRQIAVASFDGRVRLYAADTMTLTNLLTGHELGVNCLAYQPGGQLLATGARDGTVRLWHAESGVPGRIFHGHNDAVNCLAWSGDGEYLVSGGGWGDATVRLWNVAGEQLATVDFGAAVRSVAVHPQAHWFAAAGSSNEPRLFHADGKPGPELVGHSGPVLTVAFSPSGRWLASGGADQTVRLWDTSQWLTGAEVGPCGAPASAVAWSHNGELLAVGAESGALTVYAARDQSQVWQRAQLGPVRSIDWSADDAELTISNTWQSISSWQAADGQPGMLHAWQAPPLHPLACTANGRQFAITENPGVCLGDATGRAGPVIQPGAPAATGSLRFDREGKQLATLSWLGHLNVWTVATGARIWACPDEVGPQRAFAFSSDGRQIATAGDDRIVRIWTTDGAPVAELPVQEDAILSLAFSPDDLMLAVGLGDEKKQARLWHLQPPRPGPVLSGHRGGVGCVSWRNDGQRLATAGHDSTIRIWEADGRPGPVFDNRKVWTTSIAWSPDGQWLAAFYGSRCQVWKSDGTPSALLERLFAPDSSVAFNHETGDLLVLGMDSTIRSYRPADGQPVKTMLLLSGGRSVTIGAGGDVQAASPQSDEDLIYLVEQPTREVELLTPAEFRQRLFGESQ